jgi:acetyltransferase-like isoleucine patch superfamily enzyme
MSWETPWRAKRHVLSIALSPLIRVWLRVSGVAVGDSVRFFGMPIVQRHRGSRITIGRDSELRSSLRSNVLGLPHPTILTTLRRSATISIGEGVGMSGVSICAYTSIEIGAGSFLGAGALITDTDHHPLGASRPLEELVRNPQTSDAASEPIRIGKSVFVGTRAMILKGCTIGDFAVIGAGAVVIGDVPNHAVVAGNPARTVGATPVPSHA